MNGVICITCLLSHSIQVDIMGSSSRLTMEQLHTL